MLSRQLPYCVRVAAPAVKRPVGMMLRFTELRAVLTLLAFILAVHVGRAAEPSSTKVVGLTDKHAVHFLAGDSAKAAITEDQLDPFFRSLSRLDGEIRLGERLADVPRVVWQAKLKRQYVNAVMDWSEEEIGAVASACRHVLARASAIAPAFIPNPWKFVKTDGSDESGAAYTRLDAIVLSARMLRGAALGPDGSPRLARLVAHETSHVFSRLQPELRDRLYARLGFKHIGIVELGPWLESRRLTNPDGPTIEHAIRIHAGNLGESNVVPLIYSETAELAPEKGRRLFDYLRFGLFPVEPAANGWRVRTDAAGQSVALRPDQVTGFFEQVGRNTGYVIHPDEIVADNLAILFTEKDGAATARSPADRQLLRDLALIVAAAPEHAD
jgi:hypothetical protein